MENSLLSEYKSTVRLIVHETSSIDINEIKRIINSHLTSQQEQSFRSIWDFDSTFRDNHAAFALVLSRQSVVTIEALTQIKDLYSQILRFKDNLDEQWGYQQLVKYLPEF